MSIQGEGDDIGCEMASQGVDDRVRLDPDTVSQARPGWLALGYFWPTSKLYIFGYVANSQQPPNLGDHAENWHFGGVVNAMPC